jgi:hypothetical protein
MNIHSILVKRIVSQLRRDQRENKKLGGSSGSVPFVPDSPLVFSSPSKIPPVQAQVESESKSSPEPESKTDPVSLVSSPVQEKQEVYDTQLQTSYKLLQRLIQDPYHAEPYNQKQVDPSVDPRLWYGVCVRKPEPKALTLAGMNLVVFWEKATADDRVLVENEWTKLKNVGRMMLEAGVVFRYYWRQLFRLLCDSEFTRGSDPEGRDNAFEYPYKLDLGLLTWRSWYTYHHGSP